jgi:hypothetical protein
MIKISVLKKFESSFIKSLMFKPIANLLWFINCGLVKSSNTNPIRRAAPKGHFRMFVLILLLSRTCAFELESPGYKTWDRFSAHTYSRVRARHLDSFSDTLTSTVSDIVDLVKSVDEQWISTLNERTMQEATEGMYILDVLRTTVGVISKISVISSDDFLEKFAAELAYGDISDEVTSETFNVMYPMINPTHTSFDGDLLILENPVALSNITRPLLSGDRTYALRRSTGYHFGYMGYTTFRGKSRCAFGSWEYENPPNEMNPWKLCPNLPLEIVDKHKCESYGCEWVGAEDWIIDRVSASNTDCSGKLFCVKRLLTKTFCIPSPFGYAHNLAILSWYVGLSIHISTMS